MLRRPQIAALMLAVAISLPAPAQNRLERRAILAARQLPISQLDSKLPAVPLERWLLVEAGAGGTISWEANDCGEQTGTEADRQRDFPICAEATAKLADSRVIIVSVAVGSFKKGIVGKPAVWSVAAGEGPFTAEPLKTLSDIPLWLIGSHHGADAHKQPNRDTTSGTQASRPQ